MGYLEMCIQTNVNTEYTYTAFDYSIVGKCVCILMLVLDTTWTWEVLCANMFLFPHCDLQAQSKPLNSRALRVGRSHNGR